MRKMLIASAVCLMLGGALSTGAFAKGKPPTPDETAAQNLSVPTIMVGGAVGGLLCGTPDVPSALVQPTGTPLNVYEVPGYYWVQKVHKWQAQCFNATENTVASVFGAWGDNLEGDAKLMVGSPIRVEIVLQNMTDYPDQTLAGYTVIKLEPSKLDRESAYGHQALGDPTAGFTDNPTAFGDASWLVHDAGITFSVLNKDTGTYAVPPRTSPTAEINATGKVVYGYNLRVSTAGNYRIQFTTTSAVTFTGQDAPNGGWIDPNNVYIDIVVIPGGGGGGGGRR